MTQVTTGCWYSREKFTETFAKGRDHDCGGISDNHRRSNVGGFGCWDGFGRDAGHRDRVTLRCRPLADPLPNPIRTHRRTLPDHSSRLSLTIRNGLQRPRSSTKAACGRPAQDKTAGLDRSSLLAPLDLICLPAGGGSPSQEPFSGYVKACRQWAGQMGFA